MGARPTDLDAHPRYDALDWWYRCTFPRARLLPSPTDRVRLRFDGLATLAEVWLNGHSILSSCNMFVTHGVDVTELLAADNELLIVFRSLDTALGRKRPRPRWKTNLVDQQQLRWFRTTLLGRIPGWTPRLHAVGPWRAVWLEYLSSIDLEELDLQPRAERERQLVSIDARIRRLDSRAEIRSADLIVGDAHAALAVVPDGDRYRIRGDASFEDLPLWWPHTHGWPALLDCRLVLETSLGPVSVRCGRIGFRNITVDGSGGAVRFRVNGVPIFCRGACWTVTDVASLTGSNEELSAILDTVVAGGGNMLRVIGSLVYEADRFYDLCDERGIMVWQDFMFANMDYPMEDADFRADVETEIDQQLRRLQRHPCIAAYCGSSEIEQQAAMFGAPREIWSNEFFSRALPDRIEVRHRDMPYWSSTPTGGALPFHVSEGLAHYYGVGAYRRALEDVRIAGVRFTPECLGFSNIPEPDGLPTLDSGRIAPPHDPAWKQGVPRDTGPGWDFEDIRDHYLRIVYGVDPVDLRSFNLERYLALSRTLTGELMQRVFDEWRSDTNVCGGGLVWFLRDLRPGAGWGILDRSGRPKAAYYFLKRAWAPRAIRFLDRGLDGLRIEVSNDVNERLDALIELLVIARGSTVTARVSRSVSLAPRSGSALSADELLGSFFDLTYSYRFGPPMHQAVVARLLDATSDTMWAEAVYVPQSPSTARPATLTAAVERAGQDHAVRLTSEMLVHHVRIDVRDHLPEDNYFALTPGRQRVILLRRVNATERPFRGFVEASNIAEAIPLHLPE
jgi:beta-mannosidase